MNSSGEKRTRRGRGKREEGRREVLTVSPGEPGAPGEPGGPPKPYKKNGIS